MPLCHFISAVDPIEEAENTKPIKDGLPETLPERIDYNGLTHFKIKAERGRPEMGRGAGPPHRPGDYPDAEKARLPGLGLRPRFQREMSRCGLLPFIPPQAERKNPQGIPAHPDVEQPTAREPKAHPENTMYEAAKLCPVVIDESLIDVESLLLARKMGWTGAVVKSPKGLTHMILVAWVAGKQKIFLAGGDMSCPAPHSSKRRASRPVCRGSRPSRRTHGNSCPRPTKPGKRGFRACFASRMG